ncbi:AMIN domain-containing protein [bacterium]|nr:AMIN domain-containing protein [bacterium]
MHTTGRQGRQFLNFVIVALSVLWLGQSPVRVWALDDVTTEGTIGVGIEQVADASAAGEFDASEPYEGGFEDRAEAEADTEPTWSARLTKVQVETENGLPVVKITTSQKVSSSMSYLSKPNRMLLKVHDTLLTWKTTRLSVNQTPLKRIRSAQHDENVWVVLDLDESVKWIRETHRRGITLRLPARYAGKFGSARSEAVIAKPQASKKNSHYSKSIMTTDIVGYQVVDVTAQDFGEKTRITVTTNGQVRYRVERTNQGKKFVLKIHGADLTWHGRIPRLPIGVVRSVKAAQKTVMGEPVVQIALRLSQTTPYLVFKDQNQILVEFNNPGSVQATGKRGNITSRISVDLQNADLRAVLRALAAEAGFDMVLTPGMEKIEESQALVTLSIKEQAFNTVLDFILRSRQMAYVVSGNTLRIGLASEFPVETRVFTMKNMEVKDSNVKDSIEAILTDGAKGKVVLESTANRIIVSAIPSDMVRVREVIRRMDVERRLVTRTFVLSYSQAEKILPAIQPMLSSLGSIQENNSENSLVVNDIPGKVTHIAKIIRSLDTKAQQVMIEARIVEVSRSNQRDLGVNWTARSISSSIDPQFTASTNPDAVGQVGQIIIGTLQEGIDLNATLSALESKGKVNTISNPRIATLNNKSAVLKASQNIPYATSNVSNGVVSNVVNYLELPISLTVKPQITKEGQVLLNPMTLEVATVVGTGSPPITSTRSATTQMLVDDGETIVIGGMVRDEESMRESKVPLLGDIPLLGFLFRSNVSTKNKVELVVFLTTHILE